MGLSIMKSFDVNTNQLIVKFPCPNCDATVEVDVSEIIPCCNISGKNVSDSENSDVSEVECEECGAAFTIEVYKNYVEGNVEVTYHDAEGNSCAIDEDDIELDEEITSEDFDDDY